MIRVGVMAPENGELNDGASPATQLARTVVDEILDPQWDEIDLSSGVLDLSTLRCKNKLRVNL